MRRSRKRDFSYLIFPHKRSSDQFTGYPVFTTGVSTTCHAVAAVVVRSSKLPLSPAPDHVTLQNTVARTGNDSANLSCEEKR